MSSYNKPNIHIELKNESKLNYEKSNDYFNIGSSVKNLDYTSARPPLISMFDDYNKNTEELVSLMNKFYSSIFNNINQNLIKVFNTKQLVMIKEFIEKQYNVSIKNYKSLNEFFVKRNGIVVKKESIEDYIKNSNNTVVITVKDSEYMVVLRG